MSHANRLCARTLSGCCQRRTRTRGRCWYWTHASAHSAPKGGHGRRTSSISSCRDGHDAYGLRRKESWRGGFCSSSRTGWWTSPTACASMTALQHFTYRTRARRNPAIPPATARSNTQNSTRPRFTDRASPSSRSVPHTRRTRTASARSTRSSIFCATARGRTPTKKPSHSQVCFPLTSTP